jgi:hypothetical protein
MLVVADCSNKQQAIEFRGAVSGMIGDADICPQGKTSWAPLEVGSSVALGDSIRTQAESQVEITFNGNNTLRLDENTGVRIKQGKDSSGQSIIDVFMGGGTMLSNIKKLSGGNNRYRVTTPTAVAAIRGTFFSVFFDPAERASHVHCLEGKVWVVNPLLPLVAPLIIVPGFFTSVTMGMVPIAPAHIPPGHWKRLHRMLPQPMFREYTRRYEAKGVDDLLLLPGPPEMRGKHLKIKHEAGMPGGMPIPGLFGHPDNQRQGEDHKGHEKAERGPAGGLLPDIGPKAMDRSRHEEKQAGHGAEKAKEEHDKKAKRK